jgi:hypothetical protein
VIVTDNHVTLLDENSPLFPTLEPSPDNIGGKVENTTAKICTGDGGSTQHHQQPSLCDILRSVVTTVYPCMKGDEQKILIFKNILCHMCLYVYMLYLPSLVVHCQCESAHQPIAVP